MIRGGIYLTTNNDNFIMQPKVDYCFKELMKDKDILKGFLSAVLNIDIADIESVELLPTELHRLSKEDKLGILDVRVYMNSKEQIDMEIQIAYFEFWKERSLFYLSKMYTEQLKSGDDYNKLDKCIHIGILNFNLFDDSNNYYSKFNFLEDKRHCIYSDKLEVHILELPKLKYYNNNTRNISNNSLYDWCKFFSIENKKELLSMYGKNEYIDKACDHIKHLSADEEKKLEYDLRFKALCDYNTQMHSSYNRGVKAGIEQGLEQGKFDTIINLYNAGSLSLDVAARELGLTNEEFLSKINNIN